MTRSTHTALTAALLILAAAAFGTAAAAAAEAPSLLWKKGENCGNFEKISKGECGFEVTHGGTDLETRIPRGIAADPNLPGHVYVAEQANSRVDEFTAWGQFVKAWGWGVADGEAKLETCGPEATPPTANCRRGLEGSGAGEFANNSPAGGIAVDSTGDVYVVDINQNRRVQKFDPEGHFLRMWGKGVNTGTSGNPDLCTNAGPPTDICGKGEEGTANGQFSEWPFGSFIAVGPGDVIYVGDKERIQEFNTQGEFTAKIEGGALSGKRVKALAVDSAGNPYVALCGVGALCETGEPNVFKLNPSTGATVCTMEVKGPNAIATDSAGDVYVRDFKHEVSSKAESKVRTFGSNCAEKDMPFGESELEDSTGLATGSACLSAGTDLYVSSFNSGFTTNSFINAYGAAPDNPACPPPPNPPEISDQYAVSVDPSGAELKAVINPRFWADTHYYVQYGTGKCSEGGCTQTQPLPPGSLLSSKVINFPLTSAGVFLSGLAPHTTYHYRFVANSSGGGPIFGVDGKVGEDGTEATFTTPPLPAPPNVNCPNQTFRGGFSAVLPDCRAYEMVSPVEKANGSIIELCASNCSAANGLDQSSPVGGKITYTSYRAFGDAEGSPLAVQYIANRSAGGWTTESISPPTGTPVEGSLSAIEISFKAFSTNLCNGWVFDLVEPPLDPLAPPGFFNLYHHDYCGEGNYEALIQAEPHNSVFTPELQGISTDGSHAIFRVKDHLTPEAPDLGSNTRQLYEASAGGPLRLLSILPDGAPSQLESSAGTAPGNLVLLPDREVRAAHALSTDGSRVYWSTPLNGEGTGPLYLRINASEEQSEVAGGECTEAEKACTLPVSETATNQPARFWTAANDGSVAIFEAAHKLYEYNAEERSSSLIAAKSLGVLGASDDASRIYLASEEALAEGASEGEPNLYLYEANEGNEEGTFTWIGILTKADFAGVPNPGPALSLPNFHTAQVSPDGLHLAFTSASTSLSEAAAGYDNSPIATDGCGTTVNGEFTPAPCAEAYLYDANANDGKGKLTCASCNPSGVRPTGAPVKLGKVASGLRAAASISTWENQLYDPHALTEEGNRLFFTSPEALVPQDTNGAWDVYEWEAKGEGDCTEADVTFSPRSDGCARLISSGLSPEDSEFIDSNHDGSEAFFKTASSLLPQDPGLIDLYDARVDGGFPSPPQPAAPCEGEACQNPPEAPRDPTPASASFHGAGNPAQKKARKKHRKHKHKRHSKRRANHNRRTAR